MNILMINGADRNGGAHELAWDLKFGLETKGNLVKMLVGKKYSTSDRVHEIKNHAFQKILGRLFATDVDFFSANNILKTREFKDADVVHCHNLHGRYFKLATMISMSKIKPLVWTLHDEWPVTSHCVYTTGGKLSNGFYKCPSLKTPPGIKWDNTRYLMWKKRHVYNNTNVTLVTPSEWLKGRVSNSVLGDKKINLIYNGTDSKLFKNYDKSVVRCSLGIPNEKKVVLFLAAGGRDNPWKGWSYVKKITADHGKDDNVLYLCIGNRDKIVDDDRRIMYLPYVSQKEMLAKYYSCADLFLFPSLADNFPLTIIEAMSCGLPVVSFDVGGVKEAVVNGADGYIAEYGNIDDLKNGIKIIFGLNKFDYKKMSDHCRQRIEENFTLDTMVNKYLNLYKKVIEEYA